MTRKRTGEPNAANVVCVDRQGGEWKRHRFGCWNGWRCERCDVQQVEWDSTAARRRAGERLVGRGGKVVELDNEEAK